ncbi:MAG: zinc finger MYND domain-containing protein [Candidatus Bathyarchaeota archaeon]|nr:zinc finger MYND domain-containing protein [Candidatus Bathyarchaeota archaeon]
MRCPNCNTHVDVHCHVVYHPKSQKLENNHALLYRCSNCRFMIIVDGKKSDEGEYKVLYCGRECLKEEHLNINTMKVLHDSISKLTKRLNLRNAH